MITDSVLTKYQIKYKDKSKNRRGTDLKMVTKSTNCGRFQK